MKRSTKLHSIIIAVVLLMGSSQMVFSKPTTNQMSKADLASSCDDLTSNRLNPDHKFNIPYVDFNKIDVPTAISTCMKAIESNPDNPRLMLNLGRAYNKQKNYKDSYYWTQKSATAEYPYAFHVMGLHYLYGEGVVKDVLEELKWYEKAANQGIAVAQYKMGQHYSKGLGVKKDQSQATIWYSKAANHGYKPAIIEVATRMLHGTPSTEDKIAGISLIYKAARSGNAEAMFKMAEMFSTGYGVNLDHFSALVWSYYAREAGIKRAEELINSEINKLHANDVVEARRRARKNECRRSTRYGLWACAQKDYDTSIAGMYDHTKPIEETLRRYFN